MKCWDSWVLQLVFAFVILRTSPFDLSLQVITRSSSQVSFKHLSDLDILFCLMNLMKDNSISSDLSHFRFKYSPSIFSISLPLPVQGVVIICKDTVSSRILMAKLGLVFLRSIEIMTMILNVIMISRNQLFVCHLVPNILLSLIIIKFDFKLFRKCQIFLFYSPIWVYSICLSQKLHFF